MTMFCCVTWRPHVLGGGFYLNYITILYVYIYIYTQMLNVWPIYLHLGVLGVNMGKCR